MDARDVVSTHPLVAVVASAVVALFNIYTGEISTLRALLVDSISNTAAIFIGFVAIDVLWNKAFDENGT